MIFQQNKFVKYTKMTVLLICWVLFTLFLMNKDEKVIKFRQIAVPEEEVKCKLAVVVTSMMIDICENITMRADITD